MFVQGAERRLVGRALIPDRLNLYPADEGPGRGHESGVTFGEGAHADERPLAELLANQFEALSGNDHVGRGKAEGEQLRLLGRVVGQVWFFGGELIVQELAGAVTDAQMRRGQELDESAVAVFDTGFGTRVIFLRELFAHDGGGCGCGG